MKPTRGFTLLEFIIVAAAIAAVSFVALREYNQRQAELRLVGMTNIQAGQARQVIQAMERYIPANPDLFVAGTLKLTNMGELVAAGELPTSFGLSGPEVGISPLGTEYFAYSIRDVDDPRIVRTVVSDVRPIATLPAVQAGYTLPRDQLEVERIVASRTANTGRERFELITAIVEANTRTATGPRVGVATAFSEDLSAFLPSVLTRDRYVAFSGWPELGQDNPGGSDNGNGAQCQNWEIVAGRNALSRDGVQRFSRYFTGFAEGYNWITPSCPAGAVELAQIPACVTTVASGSTVSEIQASLTYVGGADPDPSPANLEGEGTCDQTIATDCNDKENLRYFVAIQLNNQSEIARSFCASQIWRHTLTVSGFRARASQTEVLEDAYHAVCCLD